jgi:hypothetical protein
VVAAGASVAFLATGQPYVRRLRRTPAGVPFVTLQIAAVTAFAAPSTALATGLAGSLSAAATWSWIMPERTCGEKEAPGST